VDVGMKGRGEERGEMGDGRLREEGKGRREKGERKERKQRRITL
jgi:hypothetical protein